MNSEFKTPSDAEIRKAYEIPQSQKFTVEIRDTLPDPDWVKKIGGFLTEASDYFGVPTFLLKKGVVVIAVFFLPYWGPKVQEEVKSAIVISYDYWVGPFRDLPYQKPEEPATRYAIVTHTPNTVSQSMSFFQTGRLNAGTSFFPISGSRV